MKKPVVDYRQFRFSKLNDPQFSHLKLLGGWIIYFLLYFLTEAFIPNDRCFVVHSPMDDLIPFCEIFVIPYVFWYFLLVVSFVYFARFNPDGFRKLMTYIFICQMTAMVIYIVFPNRQDLRPEVFPRENVFSWVVSLLYDVDTNTNVCPSMHVAFSIAMASVWLKEKTASLFEKWFVFITAILVCLSTVFIKQHSVVDGFASLGLCFVIEVILYGKSYWMPRIFRKKAI